MFVNSERKPCTYSNHGLELSSGGALEKKGEEAAEERKAEEIEAAHRTHPRLAHPESRAEELIREKYP